jgi:hypothetical protein
MQYLLLVHYNNSCKTAPQCYVIRTLPVLLILDTHHLDTQYLRQQGCEDPWLFFEAKRGPRAKMYGKRYSSPTTNVTFHL